jgi:hypothetical protein
LVQGRVVVELRSCGSNLQNQLSNVGLKQRDGDPEQFYCRPVASTFGYFLAARLAIRKSVSRAHVETSAPSAAFSSVSCSASFKRTWKKTTPAMAAGLTNHPWTIRELVRHVVPQGEAARVS